MPPAHPKKGDQAIGRSRGGLTTVSGGANPALNGGARLSKSVNNSGRL
jgi:hypothetical protein